MTSVITLNKLIFDGAESDFYTFKLEVDCPVCDKKVSFLADDMISMEDFGVSHLPKSAVKALKLKRRSSGSIYENEKGLESYVMECTCGGCGSKNVVVASIGEIQPSRFQVIADGVVAS